MFIEHLHFPFWENPLPVFSPFTHWNHCFFVVVFFLVDSQELFFKHTVHVSTLSILCIKNTFCHSQTFRMNSWLPQGRIGGGEG